MKPRIRTIKPEAFTDEQLWDLEQETGLPIFRAFSGLWCHADREGRFEWRPRPLKAGILPYWDGDFLRVLDALTTRGFVVRYTVNGREYGHIPGFKRHQAINAREEASKLPAPDGAVNNSEDLHACGTREALVADASGTRHDSARVERNGMERNGMERNGTGSEHAPARDVPPKTNEPPEPAVSKPKEPPEPQKPRQKRWRRVPDSWIPNDTHTELAADLAVDIHLEVKKFRDHEFRDPKSDADAAFRTWIRNAAEFAGRRGPQKNQQSAGPKNHIDAIFERAERLREAGL